MSEEKEIEPNSEIKTEYVGCYITESDKDMLAGMTRFLYMFNFIDEINTSKVLRFSINLCYWFVMQEMNKFFAEYQDQDFGMKPASESNTQ